MRERSLIDGLCDMADLACVLGGPRVILGVAVSAFVIGVLVGWGLL